MNSNKGYGQISHDFKIIAKHNVDNLKDCLNPNNNYLSSTVLTMTKETGKYFNVYTLDTDSEQ